ncbi:MAG TPA: putative 2OG-Fe(II) oxygenase [Steroidobacteraceae bacterium]|nr:putative 2OG-Fe(II) oxygenase [Steroidobacteraceae bacterium]
MVDITPFFAVPFGFAKLESHASLHAELRALFLERESAGTRYANPRPLTQRNRQVFESEFQLFKWPDKSVQTLKEFCWRELMQMIGQLNGYDIPMLERMLIYSDAWFHVTRRGGFFALHNHPMASWSGVYCVDPGRHDADKPDSGLLSFVNPSITAAMYLDAATANIRGPYAYHVRHVRLEPGQLVMFPSWVLHDVKPYEGEGERITVAFNCWFGLKDAPAQP